ncbi:LolA-related protein [Piscinibacter gummiphilus]|uniref:LolA-related protein n=1 Tax=Piscinibacter gummiphilus TaxID=946333 RepID=A0ABZ0CVH7_9BURK|nr:LolA-related protein [Piscinibacter gummiphilus]WOB08980.1 LolA-related protein [Piscinibacter gummiphilus]
MRLLPRREFWPTVGLLAGLLLALALPLHARAFDLPELSRLMSQVKSGEAVFTEKRSVAMLERTLESSGRLSFSAPDTFVRETLKPRPEKVSVVGNILTLTSGNRTRTLRLDAVPEAAVMTEAIRGTLTGNRQAIERNFIANVSGQPQRWLMELVPIEPQVRDLVRSVQIAGQQSWVREVTVVMADGDRSVMSIEQVSSVRAASAPN